MRIMTTHVLKIQLPPDHPVDGQCVATRSLRVLICIWYIHIVCVYVYVYVCVYVYVYVYVYSISITLNKNINYA